MLITVPDLLAESNGSQCLSVLEMGTFAWQSLWDRAGWFWLLVSPGELSLLPR